MYNNIPSQQPPPRHTSNYLPQFPPHPFIYSHQSVHFMSSHRMFYPKSVTKHPNFVALTLFVGIKHVIHLDVLSQIWDKTSQIRLKTVIHRLVYCSRTACFMSSHDLFYAKMIILWLFLRQFNPPMWCFFPILWHLVPNSGCFVLKSG
jgi:hypothetical protein